MDRQNTNIPSHLATSFVEAVQNRDPVAGLTHNFYRYPARFSPLFARTAILTFTKPNEVVLDPFMGGGTTLVEAYCAGRIAIGLDISSLATFVSRTKTTPLSDEDFTCLRRWAVRIIKRLNLHNPPIRAKAWIEQGYQRNISGKKTWPIRKTLELALAQVRHLKSNKHRQFARCALLKTAQWALDCRTSVPTAEEFRKRFLECIEEMIDGAKEFSKFAHNAKLLFGPRTSPGVVCLNRSAIGIETEPVIKAYPPPKLILTSPPYPGVHVLYHRWQIHGRKETPAPFWIINSQDGHGESFYTFGNRKVKDLSNYYGLLLGAYTSLARISSDNTLVIQMVAFSDPSWQLPKYLDVLQQAGFAEVTFQDLSNSSDGRLWREVPNRKWYADKRGALASSKEVVLFHRLT